MASEWSFESEAAYRRARTEPPLPFSVLPSCDHMNHTLGDQSSWQHALVVIMGQDFRHDRQQAYTAEPVVP